MLPGPPVRYPLALAQPDFLAPGSPLALADLRYAMPGASDEHLLAARVRVLGLGYASFAVLGERTSLALDAHRLSLSLAEANDDWALGASLRLPRVVFWADARSHGGGRSWTLGPTVQARLLDGVELYGWLEGDSARPRGRSLTDFGAGALLQRGARLEAGLRFERRYASVAGGENRIDAASASLVAQLSRAELTAFGVLDDTAGRFPRREAEGALALRLPLSRRLLLEADGGGRFDRHSGALRHGAGGALTWFGRTITLPRAGRAAERAVELARAARASGEYERAAFGSEELRAQRERLSLSGRARELLPAIEQVYLAQVDERALPLAGVRVRRRDDLFTGERSDSIGLLLGVPWPPAWPWAGSEGAVPFLTLELDYAGTTTASHYRSDTASAALTLSLNREMDLVLRYLRREPNALEVVRGVGLVRRFAVEYVYARGR